MTSWNLVLMLSPIVLLGYTAEVMTGFGSSLIVVTLGAHVLPVEQLVPVVVALNLLTASYVVLRHWRHVLFALAFRQIFPAMGVGIALGLLLEPQLSGLVLKRALGVFVTVFALRLLWRIRVPEEPLMERWKVAALQVLAGIAHAFFSTGGPPLVASLAGLRLNRETFRATLSLVWCVFSSVLLVTFLSTGRLEKKGLELWLALLPVLPLGVLLGEWLHHHVPERAFRVSIGILLCCGGLGLLVRP